MNTPFENGKLQKRLGLSIEVLVRHVGRPRKQWTYNTLALIWNHICHSEVDFNSSREHSWFLDAANREQFENSLYQVETWTSKLNRFCNLHLSYVIQFPY